MVGINEKLTAPAANEAEVTLIGGTAGFGETVIIHIGNGIWVVVDSCTNPLNGECVALSYFTDIEVKVEEQLRYVVCTHWHEDHIMGLSKLIEACSGQTVLAMSCADDREKFVYEMMEKCNYTGNSRKLTELRDSINKANKKGIKIKRVQQDQMIFNKNGTECFALSPSSSEIDKFSRELACAQEKYHKAMGQVAKLKQLGVAAIEEAAAIEEDIFRAFADLITEKLDEDSKSLEEVDDLLKYKDAKRVETNNRCVAMLLKIKGHNVVLGADLEHDAKKSPDGGWQSVSDSECMEDVEANLYKIPHHGSETGYYEYFLHKHIKPDAVSKLTSWIIGAKVLPKAEMLRKYYNHSKNLYVTTTSLLKRKNNEENRTFRKIMNESTEEILEFKPLLGIIRSRINIDSEDDTWRTEYFGSAKLIEKDYLDSLE